MCLVCRSRFLEDHFQIVFFLGVHLKESVKVSEKLVAQRKVEFTRNHLYLGIGDLQGRHPES